MKLIDRLRAEVREIRERIEPKPKPRRLFFAKYGDDEAKAPEGARVMRFVLMATKTEDQS